VIRNPPCGPGATSIIISAFPPPGPEPVSVYQPASADPRNRQPRAMGPDACAGAHSRPDPAGASIRSFGESGCTPRGRPDREPSPTTIVGAGGQAPAAPAVLLMVGRRALGYRGAFAQRLLAARPSSSSTPRRCCTTTWVDESRSGGGGRPTQQRGVSANASSVLVGRTSCTRRRLSNDGRRGKPHAACMRILADATKSESPKAKFCS